MKKKVLIGYIKDDKSEEIANTLYNYFICKNTFETRIIDLSEFSNKLGKFGINIYNHAKQNTQAFSLLYGIINNKTISSHISNVGIRAFDLEKVKNQVLAFNPDFVISLNPNVSYIISLFKKEMLINSKLLTLITELNPSKLWIINNNSNYFAVDNIITKSALIKMGINEKIIYPFGFPKNSIEETLEDRKTILRKYSLREDIPTFMFFAGGTSGYDYTYDYFKTLVKQNLPINIIFMAGKNRSLKTKCENYCYKNKIKNTLVLGYIKSIDNLMNASDFVITKPGSKTLIECIALKKPSILIPEINGEELYNAKFMIKNHYSVKVKHPLALTRKVKMYIKYPFLTKSMKNKLNKVNTNNSLKSIYDFISKEIGSH